ncbi:MAG: zinc metalloprotease HtpX [Candidatus Bathyarchaeia archaeon]
MIKLRLSMIGTLLALIGISTLAFAILLSMLGSFNIIGLVFMTALFNIGQWLIAPYLIGAMYKVNEAPKDRYYELYNFVESISRKTGLKTPKLMIADLPIPNAFAYGSPISGPRVAVTKILLNDLEGEEVEAVLGHELGHLKNRDVQVMMFASILPAIFYFIGYSLMSSSAYGGYRRDRESGAGAAMIGLVAMAVYWVLNLFVMGLSRIREYYADQFSARNIQDGPRKLSEALAKISRSASVLKQQRRWIGNINGFKALMISDPDQAEANTLRAAQYLHRDSDLVQSILNRRLTLLDRVTELFSTHPNIVKRLQALQGYQQLR